MGTSPGRLLRDLADLEEEEEEGGLYRWPDREAGLGEPCRSPHRCGGAGHCWNTPERPLERG